MKSRESMVQLRRFDVDEKQQKVADIEAMIQDFSQMVVDLDRQIEVEQERAVPAAHYVAELCRSGDRCSPLRERQGDGVMDDVLVGPHPVGRDGQRSCGLQ